MDERTYGKMTPGGSVSEMLLNRRPAKTCLIFITLDGTKLFSLGRKAEHRLFCVYGWERWGWRERFIKTQKAVTQLDSSRLVQRPVILLKTPSKQTVPDRAALVWLTHMWENYELLLAQDHLLKTCRAKELQDLNCKTFLGTFRVRKSN